MTPRNTRTGGVLEAMVLPALTHGGYKYRTQVCIGERLGCGAHNLDALAERGGRKVLISLKWQQVSGTAEQKVPFEVICLVEALAAGEYHKAYIVLGGEGWKMRAFYTSGGLMQYIPKAENIEIMTLEGFVAKANQGKL